MSRRHSIDAYQAMLASGKVARTRGEVCAWLHAHGPATRNEIDAALGGGRPNPPHSRRIAELRDAGLIHVVGERDGADVWDVTELVPATRPAPKVSRRQQMETALAELAVLLRKPSARSFPDGTIDLALVIVDRARRSEATP
jgi:DNA-binding transcriptional ArsR family regulator